MRAEVAPWVTVGGLLCLAVVVALAANQVSKLDAGIAKLVTTTQPKDGEVQTYTSKVTNQSGLETTIVTTQQDGETIDVALARHLEACQKWQQTGG